MATFTKLQDKEEFDKVVSDDTAPSCGQAGAGESSSSSDLRDVGDSVSLAPVCVSLSPLQSENKSYEEQIQEWISKSNDSKPDHSVSSHASGEELDQVGTLRTSVREELNVISEVTLEINRPDNSEEGNSSFFTEMAKSFRNSFKSKDLTRTTSTSQESEASTRSTQGKQAWKRVQDIIRFGSKSLRTSSSILPEAPNALRVRGKQLGKPLREVVRQREIVTAPKDIPDDDQSAPRTRPAWGTSGAPSRQRRFENVEAIVSKASSYAGPKNVKSEEEGSMLYWLSMTAPYLKVAGFVVLATFDLVLALVFHIFWSEKDFMCDYETGKGSPEVVVCALLSTVAFGHFVRQVTKLLRTDGGGDWIGLRYFYSRELFGYYGIWVNNFDFFLNAASATVLGLHALDCGSTDTEHLYHIIVRRIHGHVHLIRSLFAFQRCFNMHEYLRQQLQIAVSVNKRRFISAETKTNLDLTYICDRLIAMAIPCVDYVMYRNDIRDVARFFAAFHYGTFLVYNLCEAHEEGGNGNYDTSFLYNQVVHVTFHDHNVPRFRCLVRFCETAADWLNAGDKNVVAVHCQGGKGRTGTFCSALQLYTGYCDTAQEALDKFALRRTQRMRYGESLQGVSSPSQVRYVHYLEAYIFQGVDYRNCNYSIMHRVQLTNMKPASMKGSSLAFIVEVDGTRHYDHGREHGFLNWEACEKCNFTFDIGDVIVGGDVTVRFFLFDETEAWAVSAHNRSLRGVIGEGARTIKYGSLTGKQMLFASFHTAFHRGNITLMKNEVDGAYHMSDAKYGDDFSMSMYFRQGTVDEDASPVIHAQKCPLGSPQENSLSLDEFMPRKINPAVQFLGNHRKVEDLFKSLCPRPITYTRGDRVVDEDRNGVITLLYISKGFLTTYPTSASTTMQSIKSVFDGEVYGVGDLLQHGMERSLASTEQEYHAGSDDLEIRVLEIPLSEDGYFPIQAPNLDQTDLAALYTYIAHKMVALCRKYRDRLGALNHKHATRRSTQLMESRGTKKIINQLHHKFGIDKTETLVCGSSAQHEEADGTCETGESYVLSNWVLFSTEHSSWNLTAKSKELIVRIHDLATAEASGDILHLRIDSSAVEDTTRRRPGSSGSWDEHGKAKGHLEKMRKRFGAKKGGRVALMQRRHVSGDVKLRLPDEETCEVFCKAINERMREMQSNRNRQNGSWDVRYLKFGYILPAEQEDEGGKAFLQHLLNISEVRTYAPGDEIIGLQNSQRSLYHIISGTALRYSNSNHMEDIGPGEMVGEWRFLAYNSGFAETSQVIASTEVKCFVTPFEQVQTICSLRKEFAARFYRGLALCCVIRGRQFRRLYQQNLAHEDVEKEEVVRMSKYRNGLNQRAPVLSRASHVFQSTANLFGNTPSGAKADGLNPRLRPSLSPASILSQSPAAMPFPRGSSGNNRNSLGRRNSLGPSIKLL